MFFDSQLHDVRCVIHAADVRIEKSVQHFRVLIGRRVLDFVLKFLEAVFGEIKKQLDAFVGGFRIADFVGFDGA